MKKTFTLVLAAAGLLLAQQTAASAEDACPDRWAKLQGAYRCEGSCGYAASVCSLPEYATGFKRWQFTNGQGASTTGVLTVDGPGTIAFATTSGWTFTTASTSDCGTTIQFEGEPKGTTWRRVDETPRACGRRSAEMKRR